MKAIDLTQRVGNPVADAELGALAFIQGVALVAIVFGLIVVLATIGLLPLLIVGALAPSVGVRVRRRTRRAPKPTKGLRP